MAALSDFFAPIASLTPLTLAFVALVLFAGAFIKGAVGFALPTVAVAFVTMVLTPQETIGILILPLLLTNLWQMVRQGLGAAWETARRFWRLNLLLVGLIGFVAQAVPHIAPETLVVVLGFVVSVAAALQLAGWRPKATSSGPARVRGEVVVGSAAGVVGGLTGVWGPPVLFYLIALGTPKTEQIRAQGTAFFLGSVVLMGAHLKSGVVNEVTLPVSVLMVVPVALGMALGLMAQDRLDAARFRTVTLAVLCLAGLNLLRQGLVG